MATSEILTFDAAHAPTPTALAAFTHALHAVRAAVVASRREWDAHEPRMWARAAAVDDHALAAFGPGDVVAVRSARASYGTVVLLKIRIPAIDDAEGAGFVHVRIHDPPNRGTDDVTFHSIWTDERRPDPESPPTDYRAVQTEDTPLEFFNE